MKRGTDPLIFLQRYRLMLLFLFICVVGLVWRMVDLTVLDRTFLRRQGNARSLRVIKIPAYRGMITDRNGEPLAISTPVKSVWVNPEDFQPNPQQLKQLARLLKRRSGTLKQRVTKFKNRDFVYLKRGLQPAKAQQIKALKIPGLYFQGEFKRYYPEAEVAAHVLGITNIDDRGQEGLELAYNDWLRGISGKRQVMKDRLGHIIADIHQIKAPKPGHNLVLSIDRRIQFLAYRALKQAVHANQATSGSAVVLDTQTGEVLAMVNQPSYNPNKRQKFHDGRYRNRAVTDQFEPGSVIKAFSIASALTTGQYSPETFVDTSPGWYRLDGHEVKDHKNNKVLTVTDVLKISSNVGVSRIVLSTPPEHFWNFLKSVGFGQRTASHFPGEIDGVLTPLADLNPFEIATLSFGYGIAVTPLQLAHAYSIFATHGTLRPVSLLRNSETPAGKRVLPRKVADQMLIMLESVLAKGGTGTLANVRAYRVAGKTATARIAGPNGYLKDHHVATFVGIAPVSEPRLVIVVVITDPQAGKYYGGVVAAPVFAKIMGGALQILNVPPDNLAA